MSKAIDYCENVFDGTHESPKPTKDGYTLITSKNIMNGYIDFSESYKISEEDYFKIQKRSRVKKWDVLFSMIGTVGNVCLIQNDNIDFAIKNMGVFSCGDEYKAKWLYFYLQSPYVKKLNENYLNGAIQKFLPLGYLRNLEIPEFDENKKKIVDFLWLIEEKIKNNNSKIEKLGLLTKDLFTYWFLQFDFPNNSGLPYESSGGEMVWNEVLKRNIPIGWKVVGIKDICKITWGQCPDGKNILPLSDNSPDSYLYCSGAGDMRNGLIVDCQAKTNASRRFASSGDVLMSIAGSIGAFAIVDRQISLGRAAMAFTPGENGVLFIYETVKTYIERMKTVASGSIQKVVNDSHIDDIKFAFNADIIHQFRKYDSFLETQIKASKENKKLNELRDFIMPLVMNGQATF